MKRVQSTILALVVLAGISVAQQKPGQQGQAQPAPAAQGQAPAGQAQAPAGQPAKLPPQAKSPEEFKAYQEAAQQQDPAALETAADNFAAKYPQSELRYALFYRAMTLYQSQNNADKAIDMGHKVLAINPKEPVTLAMVASFIAERTRETDLDKDERLSEALQDAQKSLEYVDTEVVPRAGLTPEQLEAQKNLLRSIAYGAMGNVYLIKTSYPEAEKSLKKAIDLSGSSPDPVVWLRYAVSLDRQKKLQEALVAANKAVELAPAGSPVASIANGERQRLLQLMGTAAPAQTTPAATPQTPPPAKQ